jgi:glycerophosphoryl diester phosphodiesterase
LNVGAKAVEFDANSIETDVYVTQDDCVILWHDADPTHTAALARLWGGNGVLYVPDVLGWTGCVPLKSKGRCVVLRVPTCALPLNGGGQMLPFKLL